MRAQRQTSIQERRIHFLKALHSVTKSSTMAEPTYASASYGVTIMPLEAAP
jgi:hypothetical protein